MRKNIQILSRQFSSQVKLNNEITPMRRPSISLPMKSFEFEPFKFTIERQNMVYGYTLEELYGRYHGLKHSPEVAREITKDTILIAIFMLANFLLLLEYGARDNAEQHDWEQYFRSDLKTKRDNIPD